MEDETGSCPAKELRAPPPQMPAKYLGLVLGTCTWTLSPRSMDLGTRRALSFGVGCSLPPRLPPRGGGGRKASPSFHRYIARDGGSFTLWSFWTSTEIASIFAVVDARFGGKGKRRYIYIYHSYS